MGLEATCKITHQDRTVNAKAQLEGDHVLIRELKLKVPLRDLRKVTATHGVLELDHPSTGAVRIHLGEAAAAEKWANKILHPPSRLDKLGVKPGVTVYLAGRFDRDFEREIETAEIVKDPGLAALIFAAADSPGELAAAAKLASRLQGKSAIWVVYPKGKGSPVTQDSVFAELRAVGVVDSKVCGFSATHTALKFVVPLSSRTSKPLK